MIEVPLPSGEVVRVDQVSGGTTLRLPGLWFVEQFGAEPEKPDGTSETYIRLIRD
jgi:hypothetical protein